jgi:cyanophycinase
MLKRLVIALSLLALALASVSAQEDVMPPTFVPIGAGYTDTFPGFLEAALPNATDERFFILMMPMSFSYDASVLTAHDLLDNGLAIERRRRQLEDACRELVAPGVACEVVVPPIWTRDAALDPLALEYFPDDLAAVYFVGGDQTIAMQILADTPLEAALADAYARGVVMGGNSAGLAILSRAMIGGYLGDFGPETGLHEGAVDVWNTPERRGLSFGLNNAIVEQHVWERARLARLLNALAAPGTPNVGIGVDSYSGAVIRDGRTLESVFGLYGAVIVDAETLGAANGASFIRRTRSDNETLSMRNVVLHLLGTGAWTYDLETRRAAFADPIDPDNRLSWDIAAPEGAGGLLLWADLASGFLSGEVIDNDRESSLAIIGAHPSADALAAFYAGPVVDVVRLEAGVALPDLSAYRRVVVHAADVTQLDLDQLAPLRDFWLNGGYLILDNAAAVIAGVAYVNEPPVPYASGDDAEIEAATQGALIEGMVEIANGLALIDVNIEVQIMSDNRYARMMALEYNAPGGTWGINGGSVRVGSEGAQLGVGEDTSMFALSFAHAERMVGDNGALSVANGLLDVFGPHERIE